MHEIGITNVNCTYSGFNCVVYLLYVIVINENVAMPTHLCCQKKLCMPKRDIYYI